MNHLDLSKKKLFNEENRIFGELKLISGVLRRIHQLGRTVNFGFIKYLLLGYGSGRQLALTSAAVFGCHCK